MDFLNKQKNNSTEDSKDSFGDIIDRNKNVDIERYKDESGLTVKKLDWGLFYIEQRKNLRTIRDSFLIFVAIMIWGVYIFIYGEYAVRGAAADSKLLSQVVNNTFVSNGYFVSKSAKPLGIGKPQAISVKGVYDFFVEIKNPNPDFWGEFDYYFANGNQEIERKKGFILPGESKYLISLNQELLERVSQVNLVLENLKWNRVNPHKYGLWEDYYKEHLNITISNENFTNYKASGISEKEQLNSLQFTAKNNTAYNYNDINFSIVLKSGTNVVNINSYKTSEFMSGETKNINITIPGSLPKISSIEIKPEKIITKDNIYIDFEGDSSKILR